MNIGSLITRNSIGRQIKSQYFGNGLIATSNLEVLEVRIYLNNDLEQLVFNYFVFSLSATINLLDLSKRLQGCTRGKLRCISTDFHMKVRFLELETEHSQVW